MTEYLGRLPLEPRSLSLRLNILEAKKLFPGMEGGFWVARFFELGRLPVSCILWFVDTSTYKGWKGYKAVHRQPPVRVQLH